jgi:exonuclease VII small subunit
MAVKHPMTQRPHKTAANVWIVTSESDPNIEYVVKRMESGELSCDCPNSLYAGNKQCKHVAFLTESLVEAELALEAAVIRERQRKLDEARRIMTNRLMGRPDDYGKPEPIAIDDDVPF